MKHSDEVLLMSVGMERMANEDRHADKDVKPKCQSDDCTNENEALNPIPDTKCFFAHSFPC